MDKTTEFIQKAGLKHGDTYNYSKVEYINSITKIIIICHKHGEFLQRPGTHLSGSGCNSCGNDKIRNSCRDTTEDFVSKARLKHGDTYDYSKVEYIRSSTIVKIICKKHGEFLQTPVGHLRGGCKKCGTEKRGNDRKSNTADFIKKSRLAHGDTYDYSMVEYKGCEHKVIIICKKHGKFLQTPPSHLSGSGCSICSNEKVSDRFKCTEEKFILKARLKHEDTYDYSKVEYKSCKKNIKIICKIHGEFLQTPDSHIQGSGCKKCSKVYNYSPEEWIEKAIEIFGDKFDYSKSKYTTAKTNITFLCKKCNYTFETTPYSHLTQKHGCKKCSGNYTYSNDEWKEKAQSMFGALYSYTKVDYKNSCTKIVIICTKCNNEFEQTPNSHLAGHGCCICYGGVSCSSDEWKEKAVQIFGTRYSYENTQYVNSSTNVFIICPEHGKFLQNPMNHLYGYEGCAKCRKIKQHSKQQILWLQFISKINNVQIQHAENDGEFSIPNTRYKADGYCLETNTIYEFHGDYWHGNPKRFLCEEYNKTTKCSFGELYQKTVKKEELIKICGFNLIICWEYDWKKLNRCITVLQNRYRAFKYN